MKQMRSLIIGMMIGVTLASACAGFGGSVVTVTPAPTVVPTAAPSPTPPVAVPVSPVAGLPSGTDGQPWWNDTVFYEIFVRSFYDSNGDGIGDFNGLTAKLDYLNDGNPATTTDLGVTGLWLMPIFPSPSYHGYDVTDYFNVNPDYGTLADFRHLLAEAHKRGIRILLDLVLNHTSDQHPWFIQAENSASPYRNWYIWSEADPGYPGPWGEKVWHRTGWGYYYGIFSDRMPDLNYNNPEVTAQMDQVVKFWLTDVGVDGFRLDAAKHLIEERALQANTQSTHQWYKQFRPFYKGLNPQALTVGELFGDSPTILASYTSGDQLDLAFDFGLASAFLGAAQAQIATDLNGTLQDSYSKLLPGQFATFLANHDQNRAISQLSGSADKAAVAASLLLTSPGVPFIYYGEEIGMPGKKPDEDLRRPMQWSADAQAGFTTGSPWRTPDSNYPQTNVAAQSADPASLLSHYRAPIALRSQHAALRVGSLNLVQANNPGVFADLRLSAGEAVLVLVNLTKNPIADYALTLDQSALAPGAYTAAPLMGSGPFAGLTVADGGGFKDYKPAMSLPAYGTIVIQLQK